MSKIKKFTSLVLICLIVISELISGNMPVKAAQDVDLASYYCPSSKIAPNSEFQMSLRVQNNSGSAITDVKIIIDGSSAFTLKSSSSSMEIDSITAGAQAGTPLANFSYNGGSNKLQVTIQYTIGGNLLQVEDSLNISQAVPKDDTQETPVDTTKYAPKIVIASNTSIPSGQVGSQITYTLPLKNTSLYGARNIVVSPVLDDGGPIVMSSMNITQTIDSLAPNEQKDVSFTFQISTNASVKTYPIKFNIQYYNTSNNYFSSSETAYLKTTEGTKLPKLALKSAVTNPSPVQAGEKFKLNINLENLGSVAAKNVQVTLLGLSNNGASITGTTNKQTKSTISGGTTSLFTYDLLASPKIETGANTLKIKLDYTDYTGSAFSEEIEFFYNVQSAGAQSVVELKNVSSPSSTLVPGNNALISCDVANTGSADAYNVKVYLSTDKEIIPRTLNTVILPVLKKGETKNVQFQLFVSDEAVTKNYPIAVNVEYDLTSSGSGTKQSAMQYVGLYVENKTGKSVPRLIIDKYSVSPQIINAGQQFTLDLSILNTSKSSTINNVKVSLASDDGTFSTINSNSFYIDSIGPKASVSKKVTFTSKADAAPKQYTISVNYEYEDEKGNPFTNKDVVGIPIQQTPRLVVGDVSIPPEAFIGNPIPVNVSFFNMGKSTLYNLMVKLEGNFRVEGTSYFVGNFETGKSDSFDGTLVPEAAGPASGFIVFTYEDSEGKSQEFKKEISFNAAEMPVQQQMPGQGEMPVEQGNKIPTWAFIVSGVVMLAVVVLAILLIRRKIRRRKELMLDEEI